MNVTRSIAYGVVGRCKTESSQKPVPIHSVVADVLAQWRQNRSYQAPDDRVFASEHYRGRKPYWGQVILRQFIRPAAQELGIQKRFGWHTFRHTYSTLLRSVGTEFKVMQELMRHSSLRSTMDIDTQAVTPAKREAQAAVLSLLYPSGTQERCSLQRRAVESGASGIVLRRGGERGCQKGTNGAAFCTL